MSMSKKQKRSYHNGKFCFRVNRTKIRTGCIIIHNNKKCIMIEENGKLTFPGGKCEETDRNVYDTALREFYEEVIIQPPEHVDYITTWNDVINDIINNPNNYEDQLISHIWKSIPKSKTLVSDHTLKTCYFRVCVSDDSLKYLSNYSGVRVIDFSQIVNTKHTFNDRELSVVHLEKFIKTGRTPKNKHI